MTLFLKMDLLQERLRLESLAWVSHSSREKKERLRNHRYTLDSEITSPKTLLAKQLLPLMLMIKVFHGSPHLPILTPRQSLNSHSTIRIGKLHLHLVKVTHILTTTLQGLYQLPLNMVRSRAQTKNISTSMENTSNALTLNARTYG